MSISDIFKKSPTLNSKNIAPVKFCKVYFSLVSGQYNKKNPRHCPSSFMYLKIVYFLYTVKNYLILMLRKKLIFDSVEYFFR